MSASFVSRILLTKRFHSLCSFALKRAETAAGEEVENSAGGKEGNEKKVHACAYVLCLMSQVGHAPHISFFPFFVFSLACLLACCCLSRLLFFHTAFPPPPLSLFPFLSLPPLLSSLLSFLYSTHPPMHTTRI